MYVATQLRKDNPIDYILYMWQIEDLIRAAGCNKEKIKQLILSKYNLPGKELEEIENWYYHLVDMMLTEGKREKGHLDLIQGLLINLESYHRVLITHSSDVAFQSLYYQVLPSLIELKDKNPEAAKKGEVEILLDGLYGYILLKLSNKSISEATNRAMKQISAFLLLLAERYKSQDDEKNEE